MSTIYQTLTQDHNDLKRMLNELVSLEEGKADHETVKYLLQEIRDNLIPHSRAEEEVLYNSLRLLDDAKDLGIHGFQEHAYAEALLRTLQLETMINANFKSTANKLKTALEHHITEEETEMFSAAKKLFTQEEAEAMVEPFQKLKAKAMDEGFLKTTLDLMVNLMPPRFSSALGLSNPHPEPK